MMVTETKSPHGNGKLKHLTGISNTEAPSFSKKKLKHQVIVNDTEVPNGKK